MIEIDGSEHSGSGTLVRYAIALAALAGKPVRITNIRAKRDKPGLRTQHLRAAEAARTLCNGRLEGAQVGSQFMGFRPGKGLEGGEFRFDIGTAGSATMLAYTLIPLGLFAQNPSRFHILGGIFQDHAPSFFHMDRVLIPLIQRMGARVELQMRRPGYLPKGQGHLTLSVHPLKHPLNPLRLSESGEVERIRGAALASHLEKQKVSTRMAHRCRHLLEKRGLEAEIEILTDRSAVQKGAALFLGAETRTGCILGADRAGKRGRSSEQIADFVVNALLEDIDLRATVDRYAADQLILFTALARGATVYRIPRRTDHLDSNIWLVKKILGANAGIQGNEVHVEGIGLRGRT